MNSKVKKNIVWTIVYILAVIWLLIALIPFLFMILSSFKQRYEMMTYGVFALPKGFYLDNFKGVIKNNIFNYFKNSIVVMAVSLTALLFISACAAYPLSRFHFKGRGSVFSFVISGMAIPIHITLVPLFIMMNKVKLYDTVWALIGPYIAFGIPISVFILTMFMKSIPKELEEAAEMDGCGKYRTFFAIIMPLAKPGIATLAIYNSVNMWNEFSFAFVLTQSPANRTLPLAIWDYTGQYTLNVPMILTVLTLSVLPMILAFIIGQDKLVKGMMVGAVKG